MAHELPALPYAFEALEPHIDARTMEIHHDKHHAAYVANLNKALEGHPDLQTKSINALISDLSAVPEEIRAAVRNNGGGHFNHTLFWSVMKPRGASAPEGELAKAIDDAFGSLDELKAIRSSVAWPPESVSHARGSYGQPMCEQCKTLYLDFSSIWADLCYILFERASETVCFNGTRDEGNAGKDLDDFMELEQVLQAKLSRFQIGRAHV